MLPKRIIIASMAGTTIPLLASMATFGVTLVGSLFTMGIATFLIGL